MRKWSKPQTFRSQSVSGTFTLTENEMSKRFTGTIPLDEPWQIGVIVGRSGTGKTSIAKELWPAEYIKGFQYTRESILDDFPEELSVADITKALSSVGFASPPDWLKPYENLSQGEKMRVDIARALCLNQDLIVFDEFTSVVDREIAKISALAISKGIRKSQKKFIAVTCHYDVLDWLEPDWVFCTDDMTFDKKKRRHPPLSVLVSPCKPEIWRLFRDYHYLSGTLSPFCKCYVAHIDERPVAFIAVMKIHMSSTFNRVSRLVVLPDYQGIGLGKKLLNFMADYYTRKTNLPFKIITSNPQLVRSHLAEWIITAMGRGQSVDSRHLVHPYTGSSKDRLTVTLLYKPKANSAEKRNFRI